jgi:hypothetical protein
MKHAVAFAIISCMHLWCVHQKRACIHVHADVNEEMQFHLQRCECLCNAARAAHAWNSLTHARTSSIAVTLGHLLAMLDEGRLINGPIFDDVHDLYNIGVVRYQVRLMRQMCTTASTTTSSAPSMFVPNTTPTPHWWPLLPLFLSQRQIICSII